jgi:hypothetical protein
LPSPKRAMPTTGKRGSRGATSSDASGDANHHASRDANTPA